MTRTKPGSVDKKAAQQSPSRAEGTAVSKQGIICGTDFSIHAAEAANVAAAIAKRLGETLLLIHVEEHSGLGSSHATAFNALLKGAREQLLAEAERLRHLGTTVSAEMQTGPPYEALTNTAVATNARLIVVGSVGQIAPSRFLIGSVAERTAETSPLPTLVVRRDAALAAWARGEHRLKVLVGHDLSASADAALQWLRRWQEISPCDVTVAHLNWPPEEIRRLGLPGPISLTENLPEVKQALERALTERVTRILGPPPVCLRVVPAWGRIEVPLIRLAQEEQSDLLIVGSHQRYGFSRFWLGSVSRGVLRHAPMSVAVVPGSTGEEK